MKKRQAKKNYKNLTPEQMVKFWNSGVVTQKVKILSGTRASITFVKLRTTEDGELIVRTD